MKGEGFLGTGASLGADIALVAYILVLIPAMLLGFVFARRKMFVPHHKYVMTSIVTLNWILIITIMAVSYFDSVAPNLADNSSDFSLILPTIHLVTGGLAQLLATYLALRMWFEKSLPDWIKVRNIKLFMRLTLALWLVTALLGIGIYARWYLGSSDDGGETPIPVTTEEPGVTAPTSTEEPGSAPAPASTEDASGG